MYNLVFNCHIKGPKMSQFTRFLWVIFLDVRKNACVKDLTNIMSDTHVPLNIENCLTEKIIVMCWYYHKNMGYLSGPSVLWYTALTLDWLRLFLLGQPRKH